MQKHYNILFYFLVLFGLLLFIFGNTELLYSLRLITHLDLYILLLVGLIAIYINSSIFRYFAEIFDIKLKFKEWFGLAVANTMHNYYTPARAGTALKAIYLKKSHNFTYANFISLTAGAYVLGFFLAAVSAVIFTLISFLLYQEFYKTIFLISIGLTAITGVIFYFSLRLKFSPVLKKIPKLHNFVFNIEKGMLFFRKNKTILIKILVFKFLFIVIMAIKLFWAFKAIGIETNFINILIVQSLVMFSMVLSITPGNLGVREGIIGLLSSMLNIPLKEAVLGALVDRAVMMCLVIFLGLIFTKVLISDLEQQRASSGQEDPDQKEGNLF